MKLMKNGETARTIMFVIPTSGLDGTIDHQREELIRNLGERAQVKLWAFALHDRDDPEAGGSGASGPHWQGVLQTSKDLPSARFESWLPGCEPVRKLHGGKDALLSGVQYLTHEDQPEKAQYPRSSVQASPGWDWQAELRERDLKAAGRSGGRGRTKVMAAVLDGDLTALEARRRGVSNERAVRIARHQYLAGLGSGDLPAVRVNFYVELPSTEHPSGVRLAEALARTLSADQRVYRVVADGVDDYDGEDVVLMPSNWRFWAEMGYFVDWSRPGTLGGARELLAVLGATPAPHTLSTRYGPTQLAHRHTVIIGTEPFEQFRSTLETAYEQVIAANAREQSFLSVPVFVPVDADEFAVQTSTQFALGRGELDQYAEVQRFRLGIADALERARRVEEPDRSQVIRQIEQRQTEPIRSVGTKVAEAIVYDQPLSADDVLDEFADLGQPVNVVGRAAEMPQLGALS